MSKIIYGIVTEAREAYDGCKCDSSDARFRINNIDYIYDLENGQVSYAVLDPDNIPDVLKDMAKSSYTNDYQWELSDYEKINNALIEIALNSYYMRTEEVYKSTCYSEWTCGYDGDVTVHRLGELASLLGKLVIFKITR